MARTAPNKSGKGKKKDKIRAVFLGYDDDDVIVRYIREDDTESVFPLLHSLIVYQTQRGAKEERCLGGKREKKKEREENNEVCGGRSNSLWKKEERNERILEASLAFFAVLFFSFPLVGESGICVPKER